jgi:hypothetical protein
MMGVGVSYSYSVPVESGVSGVSLLFLGMTRL